MMSTKELMDSGARVSGQTANDNHSRLVERRQRQVQAWAKDLAHQIDRRRFEQAWVQIGQPQV